MSELPQPVSIEAQRDMALWLLMGHDIFRYLIVNTSGRLDGALKAHHHLQLSKTLTGVVIGKEPDLFGHRDDILAMRVHDATQEVTSHLDRIGFPVSDPRPDYDAIAPRLFAEFVALGMAELAKIPAPDGPEN